MSHKWLNKYSICHPDDAKELDLKAAKAELSGFEGMVPDLSPVAKKGLAEKDTYKAYADEHHRKGAEYHLRCMRTAMRKGYTEDAGKHNVRYALHCQALGENPFSKASREVGEDEQNYTGYKDHPSDGVLSSHLNRKKGY